MTAESVRDPDAWIVCGSHSVRYRAALRACPHYYNADRTGRKGGSDGTTTTPVRVVPGGAT